MLNKLFFISWECELSPTSTILPSTPPDVESRLSIEDLSTILQAVFKAHTKSYKIGLILQVPVHELESIAAQFDAPGDKLLETLKVWLKTATKPTWQAIVEVGEASLATDIEAKYCTAVETGQASGQTMPEVQPTATDIQLQSLQKELRQIKDLFLQDSQRHKETLQQESQRRMDTLQQELQDSLRQIQEQSVQDRQTGQRQLQELNQKLQAMKQQPQETIIQLNRQLQQTQQQMEEQQHAIEAREGQLRELNQQPQGMKRTGAQENPLTRLRQELQAQPVEHAAVGQQRQLQKPKTQQLQLMQRTETPPQKALVQQKTIRDMKWQKEPKAPEDMRRGSAASDSNMAYFNGRGSKVYSYDSETQKWHQLPDTPHTSTTLVVVQHILTMVGGYVSGKVTNSLLSLMGEGGGMKWLPHFPAMPTAREDTAAVCSGHSLIVAGGTGVVSRASLTPRVRVRLARETRTGDGGNRLASVEVLDIDAQQWSTACSLPHPFPEATISICRERLYLMGGWDKTGRTRSVLTCSVPELLQSQTEKLRTEPEPDRQTTKWRHIAAAPSSLSSCATVCGQLVAVGGWKDGKNTSAIFVYKETTDSWEAMGDMPTARRLALVAILNGKLMVVGGLVGGHVGGRWGLGWGTETDVVEILC